MSELLDWAEKAGMENLRFRLQNAETLAKEAASTLTIILAGMGGALAYAVKGFEQAVPSSMAFGAAGLSVWLMVTGAVLVCFCILSMDLPTPTNDPLNLYQKKYTLDALREVELKNIQERIALVKARNHRVAAWLDRSRLLALASPLIFVIVAVAVEARWLDLCVLGPAAG